jgi:hypothetical protein
MMMQRWISSFKMEVTERKPFVQLTHNLNLLFEFEICLLLRKNKVFTSKL